MLRRLLRFVCLLAVVLALVPPLRATPTLAASDGWNGIGIVDAHDAPEIARASGARWQRLRFFWNEIQPEGPHDWHASAVISDAELAADRAAGMTVVGIIGNPPAWATRNGSVPSNLLVPLDDPQHYWARFVERLAREYAGRVDAWIIWNEPDIDAGHPGSTWAGSEEEYYRLLKSAYQAIKRANPKATVVFGGTTYWFDHIRNRKIFLERILERAVLDEGAREAGYYFDVVDVHLYSSIDSIESVPRALREVLRRYGTSKPIWISEANIVPHDDPMADVPRGGNRGTLAEQASFVVQALALARAAGVERIALYKLVDGKIEGGEPFGLVRNDDSRRPAYGAFQAAARYLASPGTVRHEDKDGRRTITIESAQRRVTVSWATGPTARSLGLTPIGSRNKVVDPDGRERDLPLPDDGTAWSFALPGATANTADGRPDLYLVGGPPVVVVEDGIGEPIELAPDRRHYPITGQTISGPYLNYFDRRGGLKTFGYPISRPFQFRGREVQFFQRHVMERGADDAIGTLNLLDDELMPYTQINGATFPGIDRTLTKTAPAAGSPGYDRAILGYVESAAPDVWRGLPVRFRQTFTTTVDLKTAFPSGKANPALLPGLNLELWGVPTSEPALDPKNHDFVYQRFQRGIMHFDKKTGATQGLLLAEYLKAILTGQNVPPDLLDQAAGSRFFRQVDPAGQQPVRRPTDLRGTDLRGAFSRVPAR